MTMYDPTFYDTIRSGIQSSASVVAPLVNDYVQASRVLDVGCGEGWWGAEFQKLGCDVLGIDGAYVDPTAASGIPSIAWDLERPIFAAGRPGPLDGCGMTDRKYHFDLAVCLEVAEHLRPARALSLVGDLCLSAPVVLFSAAIPGQGGTGHLNEQWPTYWAHFFQQHGYAVSGALRWEIWNDDRVENWYRQNLLICSTQPIPIRLYDLFSSDHSEPYPIVHPVLYNARRS